jgi:hypothetical protein
MIVLRILKFDTEFPLPHIYLVLYIDDYRRVHMLDAQATREVAQNALNWVNDAVLCDEVLDYIIEDKKAAAKAIAITALFMAIEMRKPGQVIDEV